MSSSGTKLGYLIPPKLETTLWNSRKNHGQNHLSSSTAHQSCFFGFCPVHPRKLSCNLLYYVYRLYLQLYRIKHHGHFFSSLVHSEYLSRAMKTFYPKDASEARLNELHHPTNEGYPCRADPGVQQRYPKKTWAGGCKGVTGTSKSM